MLNLQNVMHKFEKTDLHDDIGIEIILRSSKNAEHDEHEHILETVAFDAAENKPPTGRPKGSLCRKFAQCAQKATPLGCVARSARSAAQISAQSAHGSCRRRCVAVFLSLFVAFVT